ncbi:hypothetical protein LC55x_3656 [Lysobacter capsici]|nr:hypothetical protein LC55x_3656 [Lysobacter capsici]
MFDGDADARATVASRLGETREAIAHSSCRPSNLTSGADEL